MVSSFPGVIRSLSFTPATSRQRSQQQRPPLTTTRTVCRWRLRLCSHGNGIGVGDSSRNNNGHANCPFPENSTYLYIYSCAPRPRPNGETIVLQGFPLRSGSVERYRQHQHLVRGLGGGPGLEAFFGALMAGPFWACGSARRVLLSFIGSLLRVPRRDTPQNPKTAPRSDARKAAHELVDHYGWREMSQKYPSGASCSTPSIKSSLIFLRKNPCGQGPRSRRSTCAQGGPLKISENR